jgi:hypothetical protein
MSSFSLTSRNLLISSFISSVTHWSLSNALFSFQLFAYFLLLFLLLISSFNALWSDKMHGIISIFLYVLRLALCPKIWPILRRFHGLLKRMYIVKKLGEIFCRHQLGALDLWYDLVLGFLYWLFVWMTFLLVIWGYQGLPLPLCWGLCVLLGPSEYDWWNWVHWHWVHIGW